MPKSETKDPEPPSSGDANTSTSKGSLMKTVDNVGKVLVSVIDPNRGDDEDERRWKELQEIEKMRRSILLRGEEPFWKILTHWDGTVLADLKGDLVLWLTLLVYVAVRIPTRKELPTYFTDFDSGRTGIIGGFLTFFMVFYVNQSHQRLFTLYGHCMAMKGRIFDAAALARTTLPRERAMRLIRYMNAAHATAYVGLSPTYSTKVYFDRVEPLWQLLTPSERARLDQININVGGSAHRELITWCLMEVEHAKDKGLLDSHLANMLRDEVLRLRAAAGQLYDAADLPIPFFYVHFICLLTILYLPLFSVTQAINAGTGETAHWVLDLVGALVVLLQSIFVIGLRVVGQKVSNPFGDDHVDFSVMFFIQFTWLHSNRLMFSEAPLPSDYSVEHDLARQRITIGGPWDGASDRGLGSGTPKVEDDGSEPDPDSKRASKGQP